MFFTREDILKIQKALLQLGVKDSELPSAEPVTYDDTLSIVQDGKNKQIGVKNFCNQISLWKREDFINITDKYDKHYISLIKAINLVPILQRKDGLVITFQDVEGNWEIYQFRGNITEFFEEDKWFNLYDYRNNIVQSIVPDEEDLTASTPDENRNSLVSLKDRIYDPTSFSGKGYKILRKNIQPTNIVVTKIKVEFSPSSDGTLSFSINGKETQVSVSVSVDNTTTLVADKIAIKLTETMTEYEVSKDASTITLTRKFGGAVTPSVFSASTTGIVCTVTDSTKQELRNILTPTMMNQPNTIYEIRYDFDLNGVTIEVPEGCTLKFEGGVLKNGKLEGNYTRIFAHIAKIVKNIIFLGTWDIQKVYTEWFDEENDSKSLQSAIIAAELFLSPIYLTKNEYHIQNVIFLFNTRIIGNNKIINGDNGTIFISGYLENGKVFANLDESNSIDGNPTHYVSNCLFDEISFKNYKVGIRAKGFTVRSVIRNCQFSSNKDTYSVDINHCWNMLFEKNTVINSTTRFSSFVDWTSIRNNAFEYYLSDDSYDSIGLLIEAGSFSSIISNNGFHGFKRALLMTGYKFNTVITSNHFEINGTCIALDDNVGENIRIENNWIKPNSSVYSELTAMKIGNLKHSWIGNNISDINSKFTHYLVLGGECDNNIFVGIRPEQIESYFNSNILINTDCQRVDDELKGYARLSITDVRGGNALDTEKSQSTENNIINGFNIKIEDNDTIIISDSIDAKSNNGLISFPYVLLLNLKIFSSVFWYIQAIVNTGKITVLSNYREDSYNSTSYIDINLELVDGKLAIRLKNITGVISGTIKKL